MRSTGIRHGGRMLAWSDEVNGVCEEISGPSRMELAIESWADWVATYVDPLEKVFFVTMSPIHMWYTFFPIKIHH